MTRRIVGIVDYGVGNLASITGAVARAGHRAITSSDRETLAAADLLVLPGVGAYPAAMESLEQHDLTGFLCDQANGGQPLLGICLGMQLLADGSFENGETEGLGLIPGQVIPGVGGHRHIGWNRIVSAGEDKLLEGFDSQFAYFNHSYYFQAAPEAVIATAATPDGAIVAAVQRDHVVGVQFHPEKSQAAGNRMMQALIEYLVP